MTMPAWLLLLWSGLAASSAAALVATPIGGVPTAAWSLAPAPRSRSHGLAWSLLAGVIGYPILYGVVFEMLQRADLAAGLVLGLLHGILMFAVARRTLTTRAGLRAAFAHLVYGGAIAFLYITP